MRRLVWAGLIAATALAACAKPDPLEVSRRACADDERPAAERVTACSTLMESGEVEDTERIEAQAHRGAAHRAAGDVTPALRDFEAVLRVDTENAVALEGRAAILLASGQLDAAEQLVTQLIETGEADASAQFMRAEIAQSRGDYAAALEGYDAAIANDQRMAIAFARRGRAKQRMNDIDGALSDFDSALRLDSSLVDARAGRCWLSLGLGRDLERARTDAETATAADPRHVEAQLCRGVLQLRSEEWTQARASFQAALEVAPGNPTALFGRGVARRRGGDNDGREDMNQARDFDRHIGEAFDDWGVRTY